MSSRQIPARVVKELYAKSGNCCAFSGCNEQLFENAGSERLRRHAHQQPPRPQRLSHRPGQQQLFPRHHPLCGPGDPCRHPEKAEPGRERDHLLRLRREHRRGGRHRREAGQCRRCGV